MTKKLFVVGAVGTLLLSAALLGAYLLSLRADKPNPRETSANLSDLVDIDEIVRHPGRFKGSVGVIGKVVKVDESQASFLLGCEDACVTMPVKYKGQLPEARSEVIVYGEIKQAEGGRYIFQAHKVEAQ